MQLGQPLLAFYGADVKSALDEFQVLARGNALLALDPPAIGLATQVSGEFTTLNDWISSDSWGEVQRLALDATTRWFDAGAEMLSSNGICWPDFDQRSMKWFWQEAFTAEFYAEAFTSAQVPRVSFFQSDAPIPLLFYWTRSEVAAHVWRSRLQPIARALPRIKPGLARRSMFDRAWNRARSLTSRWTRYQSVDTNGPDRCEQYQHRVVIIMNSVESFRLGSVAREVAAHLAESPVAVVIGAGPGVVETLNSDWELPVLPEPTYEVDPADRDQFVAGLQQIQRHSMSGDPEGMRFAWFLRTLAHQFNYMASVRWPALAGRLRAWTQLWQIMQPSAVIVSSLDEAENKLAAEAAKRMGIATLAMPHGLFFGAGGNDSVDGHLYGCLLQKRLLLEAYPVEEAVPCKEAFYRQEYATEAFHDLGNGFRVLALTNPVGAPELISPYFSPQAQLMALRELVRLSQRMSLNLRLKTHPSDVDRDFYSAVEGMERLVLPADSDLETLLSEVDLVVAVNYVGSAAVNSFIAGRPTIFLVSDEALLSDLEPIAEGGIVVSTGQALSDTLVRAVNDSAFLEDLRQRACRFRDANLSNDGMPSLDEILLGDRDG